MRRRNLAVVALTSALLMPATAWAQQASGIAGVVRDSSGGVLPGVTVEAASPALIEKTRTVVTDGEGRYNFVDLRPGTYSVTFTLTGFNTVVRPGVELTSGFTANINATMAVGGVQETVTVSGASPVVDVQNAREQTTINSSQLDSLPAGNVGLQTLAYVTPGFAATQADVGGTRDTWSAQGNYTFYHGKLGTRAEFDGFRNQYFIGAASGVGYITDQGNIQELQLETSGMTAESGSGTVRLNAIPKSGSNIFAGGVDGFFSNSAMQSSNLKSNLNNWAQGNPALLNSAQAITTAAQVQKIYRLGAQFGGPIKQDKLWFFTAIARWGSTVNEPSAYYNPLQDTANVPASGIVGPTPTLFYPGQPGSPYANVTYQQAAATTGKSLTPAAAFDWYRTHAGRLTYNLNSKNRINVYGDLQKDCRCTTGPFTGANAIEQERGWDWYPSGMLSGTWTAPLTNRLLLEAGASYQTENWVNFPEQGVTQYDRSILETTTGYRYGATALLTAPIARTGRAEQRFSAAYVTGSHNIKFGYTNEKGFNDESYSRNNVTDGLNYDFANGKPITLQYEAQPLFQQERGDEMGFYGQDAWTIKRVTVNVGLRYDWNRGSYPSASLPAGLFVPARQVTALNGIPDWKDWNPRLGASWDIFGNGRTALKGTIGRYVQLSRSDFTQRFHPFTSSGTTASRTWTDSNGNYIPDCNLQSPLAQNLSASGGDICGPLSNQTFGQFIPGTATFADDTINANRDFIWDYNVLLQHELTHGLSAEVGYNHNRDGNFTVTQYVSKATGQPLAPSNFDEFCLTVPTDARLPTSGQRQCGYYDLNPSVFGQYNELVTNAKDLVGQNGNTQLPQRYWDGAWVTLNGRLAHGILVGGGIDTGRQVDNHCFTVNVPNQPWDITGSNGASRTWNGYNSQGPGACEVVTSWANNTDLRLRGSVPIKGGFVASAIFRNTPGAAQNATITVSGANVNALQVAFKDGRACTAASCLTGPTAVNLITPNSLFGPRFNQLDLSVNKTLNLGWSKLRVAFDLYNALNGDSIQNVTTTYGPTWLRPSTFLDPRLARITGQLSF